MNKTNWEEEKKGGNCRQEIVKGLNIPWVKSSLNPCKTGPRTVSMVHMFPTSPVPSPLHVGHNLPSPVRIATLKIYFPYTFTNLLSHSLFNQAICWDIFFISSQLIKWRPGKRFYMSASRILHIYQWENLDSTASLLFCLCDSDQEI